jgi:hypothetical protein
MEATDDQFDIGFLSSTAYATGVTITATLPADPSTIATTWEYISSDPYAFNKWWNPTENNDGTYTSNFDYVVGDYATFVMLMPTTSTNRYEVGDTSTWWLMVDGTDTAINADHKSTTVTWAGSEMLQASTAAAIIALTSCLF